MLAFFVGALDTNYFDYIVNANRTETIDTTAALTEPHSEALFTYDGIVWVYKPGLNTSYTGTLAEEFSRVVGEAYDIAHSLPTYFGDKTPISGSMR